MAPIYAYGDTAHKHAVTAVGSKSYGYDANGNMTNRAGDALSYDNENHLASVTVSNWLSTTLYTYDADGQRARKRVVSNGVTTTTYYVGNWLEVTEGVTTTYYYLGGQRVAMRRVPLQGEQQVTYLHSDHLGSTSAWSGSNSGSQAYYPFGLVRTTMGTSPTDVTYTGQRVDKSTAQNTAGTDGLLYYGARYYDASLGRWSQPDNIVPDPYNPQQMNRYSYVVNNPVNHTDPTGHFSEQLIMKMMGKSSWEEVTQEFSWGKYRGDWGLLEVLRQASDGDRLSLSKTIEGKEYRTDVGQFVEIGMTAGTRRQADGETYYGFMVVDENKNVVDLANLPAGICTYDLRNSGGQTKFTTQNIDRHNKIGLDPSKVDWVNAGLDGVSTLASLVGLNAEAKGAAKLLHVATDVNYAASGLSLAKSAVIDQNEGSTILSGLSFIPGIGGLFSGYSFTNDIAAGMTFEP